VARQASGEDVEHIVHRRLGHANPRRVARAADVRRDDDIGQLEQRIVRRNRLRLGYIETCTAECRFD
jgi:hypothetical protein